MEKEQLKTQIQQKQKQLTHLKHLLLQHGDIVKVSDDGESDEGISDTTHTVHTRFYKTK